MSTSDNQTFVKLDSSSIQSIEGKLLTIVDASIADVVQRKALKDIVRQSVWDWACNWQSGFTQKQWDENQSASCGSVEAK